MERVSFIFSPGGPTIAFKNRCQFELPTTHWDMFVRGHVLSSCYLSVRPTYSHSLRVTKSRERLSCQQYCNRTALFRFCIAIQRNFTEQANRPLKPLFPRPLPQSSLKYYFKTENQQLKIATTKTKSPISHPIRCR